MPLWGSIDQSNNSPLYVAARVNLAPNTTNRDSLFGNTTVGAFVPGVAYGVFGVDAVEAGVSNNSVSKVTITSGGGGYTANAVITLTGNATANSTVNVNGRVSLVTVVAGGNTYTTAPAVTIAAPTPIVFNANTAVDSTLEFITLAGNVLQTGDKVQYLVAAGNTALAPFVNATSYFVVGANSTGIQLAATSGGAALNIVAKGLTEAGHTLTGQTASAVATITGGKSVAHAGWVLRKEGTGGRTGRVTYETLVASGSITSDAADDATFKDA
jgi:hypothetical protein